MSPLLDRWAMVFPQQGLKEKLALNRPLRVKLGVDPTMPDLHLGHSVLLHRLRDFQKEGHDIHLIIGDFTARIGDPTGRNKMRPALKTEDIQHNIHTYVEQVACILDMKHITVHYNATWLSTLALDGWLGIVSRLTVAQILQRKDFAQRYAQHTPIGLHEMMYPVMQAYDSVAIRADIELGGTDQSFNCLLGRDLQATYDQDPQVVACMPILEGINGQEKMSKSLKNTIGLREDPRDMYGKLMSIPDTLLPTYMHLLMQDTPDMTDPLQEKKRLALAITTQYWGKAQADTAAQVFYTNVQNKGPRRYEPCAMPPHLETQDTLLALCRALRPQDSTKALKRLIAQGGVACNDQVQTDPYYALNTTQDHRLKIGKHHCFHVQGKKI